MGCMSLKHFSFRLLLRAVPHRRQAGVVENLHRLQAAFGDHTRDVDIETLQLPSAPWKCQGALVLPVPTRNRSG